MTAVHFAVAMRVQRILERFGTGSILVAGVALTLAGMLWLSRAGAGSSYLTAIALPMLAIGAGQGLAFAPLTSLRLRNVTPPKPVPHPGFSTPCTSSVAASGSPR